MDQSTQEIIVSIVPGDLTLEGPDIVIREPGKLTLKDLKVSDARGGETGWSLTTSFPNAQKVETKLVQTVAGSAPGIDVNAHGIDPVTIASKDDQIGSSGSTGGVYVFDVTVYFPLNVDVQSYGFSPFGLN